MKKVIFHPKAREAIRAFPEDVRKRLGRALFFLQSGEALSMPDSRAMQSVSKGVSELRIKSEVGYYRVLYLTRDDRGILVFHAFKKKSKKTPTLEIALAQKRLKELLND